MELVQYVLCRPVVDVSVMLVTGVYTGCRHVFEHSLSCLADWSPGLQVAEVVLPPRIESGDATI